LEVNPMAHTVPHGQTAEPVQMVNGQLHIGGNPACPACLEDLPWCGCDRRPAAPTLVPLVVAAPSGRWN
jgi:hypothetical protein